MPTLNNRKPRPQRSRTGFFIAFSSLLLLYGVSALAGPPDPASVAEALNKAVINAVNRARPAVVYVTTERQLPASSSYDDLRKFFEEFGPRGRPSPNPLRRLPHPRRSVGVGSGFIIDPQGHILTNHHVIGGADRIMVKLSNGREYPAEVVGSDPQTDIALLQLKTDDKLPAPVTLGDSDTLRVGEWVLAIGNPLALDLSVSSGIISALGRADVGIEDYEDFIQTDAAINVGNSGGPLVNLKGEVVGINTAIASRGGGNDGIGFAIPINSAKWISKQFLTTGKITRGFLGVGIQSVSPELADTFHVQPGEGVLVRQVMPGSAAEKAGVQRGDVILKVGDKQITGVRMLRYTISQRPPGEKVELLISRAGKKLTLTAELGEMESKAVFAQASETDFGMSLQDLTKELAQQFDLPISEGVLVAAVEPGSPADKAGIRRGSVIREVNRTEVKTVEAYRKAVRERKKKDVLLWIQEAGGARYVMIETE